MQNLILIDGNYIGYGSFQRARPRLVGDKDVRAIDGFLSIIHTICKQYRRSRMVVLWDGRSWRYQHCPTYKSDRNRQHGTAAQRKAYQDGQLYKSQVGAIKDGLRWLGVTQISAANMEADDLAGMLTKNNKGESDIVFVTGDKDWLQLLIRPTYIWWDLFRNNKVTRASFYTHTELENTFQLVDFKAMVGDSDNIPGVGGMGEVRARQLLNEWGSVDQFFATYPSCDDKQKWYLTKFYTEGRERYKHNIALIDLFESSLRPKVEKLNTDRGEPSCEQFEKYCYTYKLNAFLADIEQWYKSFQLGSLTNEHENH